MGKTIPLPAPYSVTTALSRVEVTNDAASGDGFQITFTLGKDGPLEYGLLQSRLVEPFTRVIIGVLLGVSPEVLIDGVITHHQVAPSTEPGMSTLTVTGKDVSVMLDLEEKDEKYDNQPDFLIVAQLIGAYAQYGLIPQPTPTTDVPLMLQRIPRQHETDLQFINRLAQRNGFVFYVEPLTFGVNTAYWGPESRASLPQPALTMNIDATNWSQQVEATLLRDGTPIGPPVRFNANLSVAEQVAYRPDPERCPDLRDARTVQEAIGRLCLAGGKDDDQSPRVERISWMNDRPLVLDTFNDGLAVFFSEPMHPATLTTDVSSPFGDRLRCPSSARGAVATKNTCCARMKSAIRSSIAVYALAMLSLREWRLSKNGQEHGAPNTDHGPLSGNH